MQLRVEGGKARAADAHRARLDGKFHADRRRRRKARPTASSTAKSAPLDASEAPDFSALQAALSDGDSSAPGLFRLRSAVRRRRGSARLAAARAQGAAAKRCWQSASRNSATSSISRPMATPCSTRRARWAWKASSRSGSTRPIAPASATTGPRSKARLGHEVVIGGWTRNGERLRSLLVGVNHDGQLVYRAASAPASRQTIGAAAHGEAQALEQTSLAVQRRRRAASANAACTG